MTGQAVTGETINADANRIVPFDSQKHAGLGVSQKGLNDFSAQRNAILVNLPEFFYASQHYPIVFLKNDYNLIQACAMTGLQQGTNLFVDDRGNWQDHVYVPAYIRRFPFYTAEADDESKSAKSVVMVDETGLEESETPFFDASGEATETWKKTRTFISDFVSAQQLTGKFTEKIAELGLFEPFDAQINPQQQKSMRVTGMYRVNEKRLNRLPAKAIRDLMHHGELSRIYAHLISLENFAKLLDLSVANGQAGVNKKF